MSRYVGRLDLSSPLEIAERAISAADDMAATAQARFALVIGDRGRCHVMPWGQRVKPLPGWVATFNRKSDPDWLAEEIGGEVHG